MIDGFHPLGFVLINRIDETWLQEGLSAVECGTYLLPQYRGRGFNVSVKQALCTRALEQFQADWAMFVVPNSNVRAKRAMNKLPWSIDVVTHDRSGLFARYLHRKSWETGQPSEMYAFPLPLRPTDF